MSRVKTAFVSGTVENDPLASGGTTLTSTGLTSLPVIAAPDIAVIVIDPAGSGGAPEVVYVTAHSSSADSATIVRAREGSSAREHASTIPWVHGPTVLDIEESPISFLEKLLLNSLTYKSIGWLGPAPFGFTNTAAANVGLGWRAEAASGNSNISASILGGTWQLEADTASQCLIGTPLSVALDFTFSATIVASDAVNRSIFVGVAASVAAGDANNRIGFRILTAGNIIAFCDNAGSETVRDTGSPPSGAEQNLKIVVSNGGTIVRFYLNGTKIGDDVTTNIYASVLVPIIGIVSSAASTFNVRDATYWQEV